MLAKHQSLFATDLCWEQPLDHAQHAVRRQWIALARDWMPDRTRLAEIMRRRGPTPAPPSPQTERLEDHEDHHPEAHPTPRTAGGS